MAEKRHNERHAIGLLVKLKFPDVRTFVERFATNVSRNGMFIRTREPREVGTRLAFEVQIAGGKRVLRGEAVVRWARGSEDSRGPPGMGLELLSLDDSSRVLLDRMIALKEEHKAGEPPTSGQPGERPRTPKAEGPPVEPGPPAAPPREPEVPIELDLGVDTSHLVSSTPPPSKPAETAPDDETVEVDLDLDIDIGPPDAPSCDPLPEGEAGGAAPEAGSVEIDVEVDESAASGARDGGPTEAMGEDDLDVTVSPETPPDHQATVFLLPPEAVPEGGPVIGIDLGTTNSCVSTFMDGRPSIIRSKEGYNTVPSIIALSGKEKLLVGHPAKGQMLTNPHRTVYGAKRLVGRRFDSATVQMVAEKFHYPIVTDASGKAAVFLGGHTVSLEEVQGLILAECMAMAEEVLGMPVHRAVVTVPAYYSDFQRQAVRESGRLAGLKVERILNEPTAAALAYGLNRELRKTILVYDLGGGTFDATAMRVDGNVFEVLATGGDTFLGGVDFDSLIVDWLLTRFEAAAKTRPDADRVAFSRIASAAENAKVELSEALVHEVHIPYLMMDPDGVPVDLRCTLTREDLESLTDDLVDRTLDVVRDVLLDAGLKPADVEDVILVGGQSRMPLVRRKIAELFGREPHPGVHPDEAVGVGAGLLASSMDKLGSIVLIDVLPMTIGVGLPGGRFKRVIERNTPLPVKKSYGISPGRRHKKQIVVSVFQGEEEHVSGNEYLGTLTLSGLRKGPEESGRLAVTFELGPECVLEVAARDTATGKQVKATLATKDTPEAIRKRLKIDEASAKAAEAERAAELSRRGGRFWTALKKMVGAS